MDKLIRQTLADVAELFAPAGIGWGVGASMLLHQYDLVESPADIDIIVAKDDIGKVDKVFSALGVNKIVKEKSEVYSTDFFYEYVLNGVEIDIMAGFKINLPGGAVYEYKFDRNSTPHTFKIEEVDVPYMTLEDWYVLYQLMPDRETKVKLIEDYFLDNGIECPNLLIRAADSTSLPADVKDRIARMIRMQ